MPTYKQAVLSWNNNHEMDRTPNCIKRNLCALCQLGNANEKLVSPIDDKRTDRRSGYKSLPENLPKFEEVGQLLIQVPLSYLDERSGTNHVLINAAVQS